MLKNTKKIFFGNYFCLIRYENGHQIDNDTALKENAVFINDSLGAYVVFRKDLASIFRRKYVNITCKAITSKDRRIHTKTISINIYIVIEIGVLIVPLKMLIYNFQAKDH